MLSSNSGNSLVYNRYWINHSALPWGTAAVISLSLMHIIHLLLTISTSVRCIGFILRWVFFVQSWLSLVKQSNWTKQGTLLASAGLMRSPRVPQLYRSLERPSPMGLYMSLALIYILLQTIFFLMIYSILTISWQPSPYHQVSLLTEHIRLIRLGNVLKSGVPLLGLLTVYLSGDARALIC